MNKTKTIIIGAFAVALLAIGATTFALINQPQTNAQPAASQQLASDSVEFTAEASKSVLEQLKARYSVETQDSYYGAYVVAINGKKAEGSQFWGFYVNGEMAQKGAADYITNGGEQIKWQLQ